MSFSKRMGYEPEKKALQFDSLDKELRCELHNTIRYFEDNRFYDGRTCIDKGYIYRSIWSKHFILDSDDFGSISLDISIDQIKDKFFALHWAKVYDYIEYYCSLVRQFNVNVCTELEISLNSVLEKHNGAYRMVEGMVIPISNSEELSEVTEACNTPHQTINNHMIRAIELFSNRESKDYPNTIKEAISAVEAAANIINGTSGKTLADALKELSKTTTIHPALTDAFIKIYGYTSDKHSGIRHAIFDGSTCIPDFADAKFMLVSCSAFINYLIQKNAV